MNQHRSSLSRRIEDYVCRTMDRPSAWWGIQRLRPVPNLPYSSGKLLLVCLATGIPFAALLYAYAYGVSRVGAALNPLGDDSLWLPPIAAWTGFCFNAMIQGFGCWCWNRRGARLAPEAFRYGHSGR